MDFEMVFVTERVADEIRHYEALILGADVDIPIVEIPQKVFALVFKARPLFLTRFHCGEIFTPDRYDDRYKSTCTLMVRYASLHALYEKRIGFCCWIVRVTVADRSCNDCPRYG